MALECLTNIIPSERSSFQITRLSLLGSPRWVSNDTPLDRDDGLDLYNLAQVSSSVPYLRYNYKSKDEIDSTELGDFPTLKEKLDNFIEKYREVRDISSESYFKVYNMQSDFDYQNIIEKSEKNLLPHTFYLTVWSSFKDKTAKDTYIPVDFFLDINVIQLNISVKKGRSESLVQERLFQALPLKVDSWEEVKVNGQFYLFDLEVDEISLIFLITINPCLRQYFYVDESEKPGVQKKRLYLHLRSPGMIGFESKTLARISFSQEYSTGTERFKTNDSREVNLRKGDPYVIFNLLDVGSQDEAEDVIDLLALLFSYYRQFREDVLGIFDYLVPELQDLPAKEKELAPEEIITPDTIENVKFLKINKLLQRIAPHIFFKNYATKTQSGSQPLPVRKEDTPLWENSTFIHKGVERKRQVMPFPPINPILHFVCPYEDKPFPGIKPNDLPNKDIFPGLPACYATDHMAATANSFYNAWLRGQPLLTKQGKLKPYGPKRITILETGRPGSLPSSISKILSIHDELGSEYQRIGQPLSTNSIIHCILSGLEDPKYINARNVFEQEIVVKSVRQEIARTTKPELLKQENYDLSDEQILLDLSNNDLPLDPARHYRALEEYFDINIFTFVSMVTELKLKEVGTEEVKNQLEIPRYKEYYVRREMLNRKTILIFKHAPSHERKGVEKPLQCELIVKKTHDRESVYEEGHPLVSGLYKFFYNMIQGVQWDISVDIAAKLTLIKTDFRNVLKIDPASYTIVSQVLDDIGKARGFVYQFNDGLQIIIMFPPTQPLNLPHVTEDIEYPSYFDIIKYLPLDISGVTYYDKSRLIMDGLWYPVFGRKDIIYVPIQPVKIENELPSSQPKPMELIPSLNTVDRLINLKKTNSYILQLTQWLYVLSGLTVDEFIADYIIVGTGEIDDSNQIYDMNRLPHRLPKVRNIREALDFIERNTEGFIIEDRIFLYSEDYYQSIAFYLDDFTRNTDGLPKPLPSILSASLTNERDFIQRKNNMIFLNKEDFLFWLDFRGDEGRGNTVLRSSLAPYLADYKSPFLYQNPNDELIYLVQNVSSELSEEENRLFVPPKLKKRRTIVKTFSPGFIPQSLAPSTPTSQIVGQVQASGLPSRSLRQTPQRSSIGQEPEFDIVGESSRKIDLVLTTSEEQDKFDRLIGERIRELRGRGGLIIEAEQAARIVAVRLALAKEIRKETVSLARALNVANTWKESYINLEYNAFDLDMPYPPHIIYGISSLQAPQVKVDNSEGDPKALKIISFSSTQYAAMLPLSKE